MQIDRTFQAANSKPAPSGQPTRSHASRVSFHLRELGLVAALCSAANSASALPITVVSNDSELYVAKHASDIEDGGAYSVTFGDFGDTIVLSGGPTGECIGVAETEHAEGSLAGNIGTHSISGAVSTYSEGCHAQAYAWVQVTFMLTADTLVTIESLPTGEGIMYDEFYVAPGETIEIFEPGSLDWHHIEMVSVCAETICRGEVTGGTLSAQVVPEPSTAAILGFGLAGLALRPHQRFRRSGP